jgi:ElaB/YqjD/DUF883 family membrane-anchored ribosome-binding protein
MNTDTLNSTLAEAAETTQRLQRRMGEKARDYTEITDRYVHENAWKTVAIAALVGCMIGYLLSHRD